MSDNGKSIKRLREDACGLAGVHLFGGEITLSEGAADRTSKDLDDAADALEAAQAENERLKKALSIAVDFAASEKAKVFAMQLEKVGIPVSFPDKHSDKRAVRHAAEPVEKGNGDTQNVVVPIAATPAMLTRMVETYEEVAEDSKVTDTEVMACVWDAAIAAVKGGAA